MRRLSPEQEQRLIDALTSLDWMMNHDRKSCKVICEQLGCTMTEAMEILQYIHLKRNLIRAVRPSDEELRPGVRMTTTLWKWERHLE